MLRLSHAGGDGNLQSCFSSCEILYALYNGVMSGEDHFILSKGQSSLALVAVLEQKGVFSPAETESFCKYGSRFSMQLDRTKFPGGEVENSAGSLGHGFPMAVGLAHALMLKGDPGRVYVLAGDGEMNEGTMWEACAFAGAHKLCNLTLIVDDNNSVGRMLDLSPLGGKLEAFGFAVAEVDGHDIAALAETLSGRPDKPFAVLAKTVRGYGSPTLSGNNAWFHKAPDAEELESLIGEVESFA